MVDWRDVFFDTTGIVPVALALLTFALGTALGMVLRRTLVSMTVTLGASVAVKYGWSQAQHHLGHVMTATTHKGAGADVEWPTLPAGASPLGGGTPDFLTASGGRLNIDTCYGAKQAACLESKHVVGWALDYLPIKQMAGMQWLGASAMFALAAVLTVFVFLRGRRQTV
ncbi:hypothetical protein ACFOZ0_08980 [Streptomyces yaanensis]|uniref:Uncharacterized protein n=1 Tax=Streptomyces yaanensis TaxID=1142239 RepID=A0ABV7SA15_9ACTN|nr:hypothetical protein [Streptomyces sp. CGMCC 4.7035]WNC02876.1 hypothetical protein Q2K21_35245 [Streptomyces sp. CGMCC 4.7035]